MNANNTERFKKLIEICKNNFKEMKLDERHRQRMLREMSFIKDSPSLVADALSFVKDGKKGGNKNIPNSLVFYVLGVTSQAPDLDSEFNFGFEVDYEESRISPPDIDVDFDSREPILDHLREVYGEDKVALIGTMGTYKAKAAIQFSAKALDITKTQEEGDKRFSSENTQEAIRLSKLVPNIPGITLSQCLGEDNNFTPPNKYSSDLINQLKIEAGKYPEVFKTAKKLEGMYKNYGTHAAGVVISSRPIVKDVPLHYQKIRDDGGFIVGGNDSLVKNFYTTQYDMKDVEEDIGLLKFDFLQIDTLRQISLCLNLIKESLGTNELPFDIENLETNDDRVLATIDSNKTTGLFQISGDTFAGKTVPKIDWGTGNVIMNPDGTPKMVRKKGVVEIIGCSSFDDIVAMNAIGRPGPLQCGMHLDYKRCKEDPSQISYSHPLLKDILKPTFGQLIYQEQLIAMAQKMALFSYSKADVLRKACGKKIIKLLEGIRPDFYQGCRKNNIPEKVIDEMWHISVEFGNYAFNKAHATAYAEVTYQTAYLKTYYPTEFICSILTSAAHSSDKKLAEMRRRFEEEYEAFKIEKPTVNKSKQHYIPGEKKFSVVAPLFSLKSVGDKVSQHIVENQPYISVEHFLDKVDGKIVSSNIQYLLLENNAFKSFGTKEQVNLEIKKYHESMKINKKSGSKPKSKVSLKSLF